MNMQYEESQAFFEEAFARHRSMVILRAADAATTQSLCDRAWVAGMEIAEVPLQGDASVAALGAVIRRDGGERLIGAGTIVSRKLVHQAFRAGAAFTVAPGYDPAVLDLSIELGMPHLPGVATFAEVQHALDSGIRWLKASPAAQLGMAWFSAMRGPFPAARFVATGGVTGANAQDFLRAGAAAVSFGSSYKEMSDERLRAVA
jgi:2-dehydro-3-deoxyphosphogluconate aldolase/(4S)-4-hydroxy-2-oxoglutarate aldolase